jgi:hypothetical protein
MRLRLLVLLPLLALAACGDTPRREAAPDPEAGDCGSYVVTNADGADGPPGRAEQQRCLLDAFGAGDRARLDVELTTEEGDPIYYRYTVLGPRLVEVRIDTTHDAFGTPAVTTGAVRQPGGGRRLPDRGELRPLVTSRRRGSAA